MQYLATKHPLEFEEEMSWFLTLVMENGEPVFNLNKLSAEGDRLIDIMKELNLLNYLSLGTLRTNGSVEPKDPLEDDNVAQAKKLLMQDNVMPDTIPGNIEKATGVLSFMAEKYKFTEEEMDELIENFKKLRSDFNDVVEYPAQWGEDVDTVYKVIEKLASMRVVNDRLPGSWDFKYVLATVIHIADQVQGVMDNFIYGLTQIRMCDLSKLINLLYIVQDVVLEEELVENPEIDRFDIADSVLRKIEVLVEDYPLKVINWLNDHLNKQEVKDPEDWQLWTQKIHGIFNNSLMEKLPILSPGSYHFNDELQILCIGLIETIQLNKEGSNNPVILKWQQTIKAGAIKLAEKFFNEILKGDREISSIGDATFDFDLSFGMLDAMPSEVISFYYDKIADKFGVDQAKAFVDTVQKCLTLNPEVNKLIENILNPVTEVMPGVNNIIIDSNDDHDITLTGADDSLITCTLL